MKTQITLIILKVLVRKPYENTDNPDILLFSGDGRLSSCSFANSTPPRDNAPGRNTCENTDNPDHLEGFGKEHCENTDNPDNFEGFGKETL